MGDAESADPTRGPLLLEPRQMLLPRDEVVHLLDLDMPEPGELIGELPARLLGGRRPDLRQHGRPLVPRGELGSERALGPAVHRRAVAAAHARVERGSDDGPRRRLVTAEGVPRAEPDDGPETAFLHQPRSFRAATPAA
jgi:hypothetical protein